MKPLTSETKTTKGHYGDDAYLEEIIEAFGNWLDRRIRQIQRHAADARKSGDCHPLLARIYRLLEPAPYKRPTHDLLCSCRKCEPSIQTRYKRMKELV